MAGHGKLHGLGSTADHSPATIEDLNNSLIVFGQLEQKFRGWDRLDTDSMGDISYDLATRTFSIAPKTGQPNFRFFTDGIRRTKASTQSVQWPDVTGTYYFYFDINGDLQYAENGTIPLEMFIRVAICGLVYYNKEEGTMWYAVDEQHGVPPYGLVPIDHVKQHVTIGFIWSHGGELTNVADGQTTHGPVTASTHYDEDIPITTEEIANIPWIYRDGSVGGWKMTDPDNRVTLMNPNTNVSVYNEEVNGVWQLTDSTSDTNYMIEYLVKTNLNVPYMKVCAQQVFDTIGEARRALDEDMDRLKMNGLAGQEVEFQYAWLGKRNGVLKADDDGGLLIKLKGKR